MLFGLNLITDPQGLEKRRWLLPFCFFFHLSRCSVVTPGRQSKASAHSTRYHFFLLLSVLVKRASEINSESLLLSNWTGYCQGTMTYLGYCGKSSSFNTLDRFFSIYGSSRALHCRLCKFSLYILYTPLTFTLFARLSRFLYLYLSKLLTSCSTFSGMTSLQ